MRTGDVVNDADRGGGLKRQPSVFDQLRVIADLLTDDLDAGGIGDVGQGGQILVSLCREDRDDVLLATGARASLDDVEDAWVLLPDLPDLVKDQQRRRARPVFVQLPDGAQRAGGGAIGERFAHTLRKPLQAVEFVDVERRIDRVIWVSWGDRRPVDTVIARR